MGEGRQYERGMQCQSGEEDVTLLQLPCPADMPRGCTVRDTHLQQPSVAAAQRFQQAGAACQGCHLGRQDDLACREGG